MGFVRDWYCVCTGTLLDWRWHVSRWIRPGVILDCYWTGIGLVLDRCWTGAGLVLVLDLCGTGPGMAVDWHLRGTRPVLVCMVLEYGIVLVRDWYWTVAELVLDRHRATAGCLLGRYCIGQVLFMD